MAAKTTYKDIQDRVLDLLNKSDTTVRGRVKNWINMGQDDFVMRELWPFRETTDTITTVAGTQEYTLVSEFTDIDANNVTSVAIQGASQSKLPYTPFQQLRAAHPDYDKDGTGLPTTYYIKSSKIGFWQSPDDAYTITVDYYKVPTELDADSDVSIIPLQYREALIHYALMMEHDFNTDPDLSIKSQNRYEQILTTARNNLLSQPNDTEAFRILGPADFKNHTGLGVELA